MDHAVCPTDHVQTVERTSIHPTPEALEPDAVVAGRYRIVAKLGGGGMGTVYAAVQLSMQRTVALKVLNARATDEQGLRRFYREAKSVSQMSHPNVVKIHDFGFDDQRKMPFIAMEMVEGRTLRKVIQAEGPLGTERILAISEQIARALVAAHQAEIVHRDLKPDNVMVRRLADGEEHVTVLDFGIAKASLTDGDSQALTRSGWLMGTPAYMSPEQAEGRPATIASDLYSLGCLIHEMATGNAPFLGQTPLEVLRLHILAPRPPLPEAIRGVTVPDGLRVLHTSLLEVAEADRPCSASTVAQVLRRLQAVPDLEVRPEHLGRFGAALTDADTHPSLPSPETSAEWNEPGAGSDTPPASWVLAMLTGEGSMRRRLLPLSAAAVVLLGGWGAWTAWSASIPRPVGVILDEEAVEPIAPASATGVPEPKARAPEPEPEPEPPPAVTVRSVPSGARVLHDGKVVGTTPFELAGADAPRTLVFRRRGYRQRTVTVEPGQESPVEVRLVRRKRREPPPLPNPYE